MIWAPSWRYLDVLTILRAAALLALAALPACMTSPDERSGEVILEVQGIEPQCDQDDCGGGNSPVINGVYFWMLHSLGEANPQGVAIKDVRRVDNVPMQLFAVHDQLIGRDPATGAVLAAGAGLINTRILVEVGGQRFQIRIADVTSSTSADGERFWVGEQGGIEAYTFRYAPLTDPGREQGFCSLANQGPADPRIKALVFTGDVYDPVTKQITLGAEASGWMNIACQNSAPYKMHKMGHTTAAQARTGIVTSLDQRKAMLNAWTMNACGTGKAYTEQGTPIRLSESQLLLPAGSPYQPDTEKVEAIWGPDGAVCLSQHRLGSAWMQAVMADCPEKITPCGEKLWATWTRHGEVRTSLP